MRGLPKAHLSNVFLMTPVLSGVKWVVLARESGLFPTYAVAGLFKSGGSSQVC